MTIFDAIVYFDNNKVKELLDSGIDVNIKNYFGETPLYFACERLNLEAVKLLLDNRPDIDVNTANTDGVTALGVTLHTIASKEFFETSQEIAKLLLTHKNSKDKIDVSKFTSSNKEYTYLSLICSQNNSIDLIKLILNNPTLDVNIEDRQGYTALHTHCQRNNAMIVMLLLEHPKINVNAQDSLTGKTPLFLACDFNHNRIVELLLEKSEIDVNIKDDWEKFPLYLASRNNNLEIANLLLSHKNSKNKINVNAKNSSGVTSLYFACTNNSIEIVKLLLSRPDIEVNADNYKLSPLYGACYFNQIDIIKLLLDHPKIKLFPFMTIKDSLDKEVINLLIKKKSNTLSKVNKILDNIED